MNNIKYFFEALLLKSLLTLFKLIGVNNASMLGGALARTIGPYLKISQRAHQNLNAVFPEKPAKEKKEIIVGVWDHLGRVIAEYPHLEKIARKHTEIENTDYLKAMLDRYGKAIFISAHFGGWEINSAAVLLQLGYETDITYRAPNNPWSDKMLLKERCIDGRIKAYSKSADGGRQMINALKNNRSLGILIDQKYNQGVSAPFFGISAKTNPFFVQAAQKYNCPVIPVVSRRLDGPNFRLTICEALKLYDDNGEKLPVETVIGDANAVMEKWILKHPEQWLWLHRRWGNLK